MTVTGLPLGKIMGELRKDIDGKCDLDLRKRMAEALGWTDLFTAYSHEYKGRVLFGYRGSGVAEPVTDWLHDSIPYRCPVCNGSRFVMAELYGGLSSGTAPTEPCQSCGSTGVIWR